jgi:hypothetical protein
MKVAALLFLLVPAQVVLATPGTPDEFTVEQLAAMAGRTLVVELATMEEWFAQLAPTAFQDSSRAGQLAAHASYLEHIEEAVRTHWTFNANVEFKTRAECFALMDQKSPDHVLLMKADLSKDGFISLTDRSYMFEVLLLQRADGSHARNKKGEMTIDRADQIMFLAGRYQRNDKERFGTVVHHRADLAFTLRQFQRCIAWCIARGALTGYRTYVLEQADQNCGRMKDFGLVAQQDNFMGKSTMESCMKSYSGRLRFASHEEIGAIYLEREASEAVLFMLAFSMTEDGRTGIFKVAVDPATDDILEGHRIEKLAGSQGPGFAEVDFKTLSECESEGK